MCSVQDYELKCNLSCIFSQTISRPSTCAIIERNKSKINIIKKINALALFWGFFLYLFFLDLCMLYLLNFSHTNLSCLNVMVINIAQLHLTESELSFSLYFICSLLCLPQQKITKTKLY